MFFSGADLKCCFYIFTLPALWLPWYVLDQPVGGKLLGRPDLEEAFPAVAVVPMGWINATVLINHVHFRMLTEPAPRGAGLTPEQFIALGAPSPRMDGSPPHDWFSVFIDNWDQGKIVLKTNSQEFIFKAWRRQFASRDWSTVLHFYGRSGREQRKAPGAAVDSDYDCSEL